MPQLQDEQDVTTERSGSAARAGPPQPKGESGSIAAAFKARKLRAGQRS